MAAAGRFDESKHPRHKKGSKDGGQFAPKGQVDEQHTEAALRSKSTNDLKKMWLEGEQSDNLRAELKSRGYGGWARDRESAADPKGEEGRRVDGTRDKARKEKFGLKASAGPTVVTAADLTPEMLTQAAEILGVMEEELLDEEFDCELEDTVLAAGNPGRARARKIAQVMREFKAGKLKSNGKVVTSRKQALAIALSESRHLTADGELVAAAKEKPSDKADDAEPDDDEDEPDEPDDDEDDPEALVAEGDGCGPGRKKKAMAAAADPMDLPVVAAGSFDESKHPRHEKGHPDGGQFSSKDGGEPDAGKAPAGPGGDAGGGKFSQERLEGIYRRENEVFTAEEKAALNEERAQWRADVSAAMKERGIKRTTRGDYVDWFDSSGTRVGSIGKNSMGRFGTMWAGSAGGKKFSGPKGHVQRQVEAALLASAALVDQMDLPAAGPRAPRPDDAVTAASFTEGMRTKLAKQGKAMSDGSFPIRNRTDLRNAISDVGRADDPEKAKRWIIKRARELKAVPDLPASWDVEAVTAAAPFEEAKHPRHEKGTKQGGQFAPKEGKLVEGPGGRTMSRTEKSELLDKQRAGTPTAKADRAAKLAREQGDTPAYLQAPTKSGDQRLAEARAARTWDKSLDVEPDPKIAEVADRFKVPQGTAVRKPEVLASFPELSDAQAEAVANELYRRSRLEAVRAGRLVFTDGNA